MNETSGGPGGRGAAACRFLRRSARYFLLLAAAALIVLGVWAGEPAEVLRKAATICLECIGVG